MADESSSAEGVRGMTNFDAIIVGAGQAGPSLAGRLTAAGMRVALVERKLLGGTCVNTGCMPTKALVASARAAHVARHAERWGVLHGGGVRVDMARVAARAREVTEDARAGLAGADDDGVEVRHAAIALRRAALVGHPGTSGTVAPRPAIHALVPSEAGREERRRARHATGWVELARRAAVLRFTRRRGI